MGNNGISIINLLYSTGHTHCQIYTHVNCEQYGGFTCKIHAKNKHVKLYTNNNIVRSLNYVQDACIYCREISSLTFTCKLCVFLFNGRSKKKHKMLIDRSLNFYHT